MAASIVVVYALVAIADDLTIRCLYARADDASCDYYCGRTLRAWLRRRGQEGNDTKAIASFARCVVRDALIVHSPEGPDRDHQGLF
jgi:hypothetical protein